MSESRVLLRLIYIIADEYQVVNDFLRASDEHSQLTDCNFTLIRTHHQKQALKPTPYPVEGGDFTTSFSESSLAELGAFCREKFAPERCSSPKISPNAFVVMDEHTLEHSTVKLVKWELHTY